MTASGEFHAQLDALPLRSAAEVIGRDRLLVVAPHPDDESLGCGGLLAWAAANGRRPCVLFLTDGEGSHPGSLRYPPDRLAMLRRREAVEACARLGLPPRQLAFLHLPDGALAGQPADERHVVVAWIRQWVTSNAPCVACVTAASDPHGDHQAAHALVATALQAVPGARWFSYPVWSWLLSGEQAPAHANGRRIDITAHRDSKRHAIAAHASQHGALVNDSDEAFVLPERLLRHVDRDFEVLLDEPV